MENKVWRMIGTMSGTSGDGLDLAYCEFQKVDGKWTFDLREVSTASYRYDLLDSLREAKELSALAYAELDELYAKVNAGRILEFMNSKDCKISEVDAIVSHGHTVFHEPAVRSWQIGNGQLIASLTSIPVISNLRNADVAAGGQGAPIVPIGDVHLFEEYRVCLNLGGIANVSIKTNGDIKAWDICGCNLMLNDLAGILGHEFDDEGKIASLGSTSEKMLEEMMGWEYLKKSGPKSLEATAVLSWFNQLSTLTDTITEDALSTCVDFIAKCIAQAVQPYGPFTGNDFLITGGGAYNAYLIERIEEYLEVDVEVPHDNLVSYKEALVMAFFGVLHLRGEPNCLVSVTGASEAVIGGEYFDPQKISELNKI